MLKYIFAADLHRARLGAGAGLPRHHPDVAGHRGHRGHRRRADRARDLSRAGRQERGDAASSAACAIRPRSTARASRPDLQAEIAAMEAEFQKGVAALKSSKLGRSGRDALGLLPWYVMIGPSASGKTTAIRSSGLKMPAGKAGKVRGVGGTRNCDWWMTNEAILLDTAGRWSTDDDDRDEWLAFLDLLKKTRPKKPINGILLADQRHRPAGRRGGDRRAGAHAARAHRRGDRAPRDGRAGLPDRHQVRPDLRLRRDLRRSQGPRARPDPGASACRSSASTTTTSRRSRSTSTS